MSLKLVSPATIGDIAELAGEVRPQVWAVLREQLRGGMSYALRNDAGITIAAGGYYPSPEIEDLADGWIMFADAAGSHVREILRHVRWTMGQQPYGRIRTAVSTVAGRRIALLVGLRHQVTIDGLEIFT